MALFSDEAGTVVPVASLGSVAVRFCACPPDMEKAVAITTTRFRMLFFIVIISWRVSKPIVGKCMLFSKIYKKSQEKKVPIPSISYVKH